MSAFPSKPSQNTQDCLETFGNVIMECLFKGIEINRLLIKNWKLVKLEFPYELLFSNEHSLNKTKQQILDY